MRLCTPYRLSVDEAEQYRACYRTMHAIVLQAHKMEREVSSHFALRRDRWCLVCSEGMTNGKTAAILTWSLRLCKRSIWFVVQ